MKAIILICILFTFLLISSPLIAARELATYKGFTRGTKNPKNPAISCGKPGNPAYSSCIGKRKPPPKCDPKYTRGCNQDLKDLESVLVLLNYRGVVKV
ncbi:hypothetical protein I3843_Q028100 [Carya illinoinensis]|nr:hypothetical protein I3843_Q028100 [Carya illinoinensis]